MLSYQNDPALKSRFMAHVQRHRELDAIAQGTYGQTNDGKWQGCAVACSLRSLDEIDGLYIKQHYNEHARLASRLGIPLVLAYLQDQIFEGLPEADALAWPSQFAAAIPVGRDLSIVWPRLALWLLTDESAGVIRFAQCERTRKSIAAVASLYARHVAGDSPTKEEWISARYAAADAAAARYADADADADAAAAADAADAADDADADADADAADAAAAARRSHYQAMAKKLLELMEAA